MNLTQNPAAFNNYDSQLTITHIEPKIARAGILARVKFDQWHIIHRIRADVRNLNALNLACLLAALARMDCAAYQVSQEEIAAKMGQHFGGKPPTRQAVARWEKMLFDAGLIEIPRARGTGQTKTKTRYFTTKFLELARFNKPEKLSYIGLHATESNPALTVSGVVPNSFGIDKTQIRAFNNTSEPRNSSPARVSDKNQNAESRKSSETKLIRPPKFKGGKPLSKFENSFRWYLCQNSNLTGPAEGAILFALFLTRQGADDLIEQLAAAWRGLSPSERHGQASQLVKHLRNIHRQETARQETARQAAAAELGNLVNFPEVEPAADVNQARALFRAALLGFEKNYSGPCAHIVERFQVAPIEEQESILNQFQRGAFDQFFGG